MAKQKIQKTKWKAGNMIYPLPAVMVSCGDQERANIVTVSWTGTVCTNPAMTYISLRPSRYSYDLIKETGYFVINLTTESIVKETDFCGVKSGRDIDKFKEMNLTVIRDEETGCPMIGESPVSIVCKTVEIKELGSHHMFIAHVESVYVDESYMDERGKFQLNETGLIAYSHGSYLSIGEELGTFGYSISKKKKTVVAQNTKRQTQEKIAKDTSKSKEKVHKKEIKLSKKVKSGKKDSFKAEPKRVEAKGSKKKGMADGKDKGKRKIKKTI